MSKTTWRKRLLGTWSWKRPFYSIGSIYLILLLITSCSIVNKLIFPAPAASYDHETASIIQIPHDNSSIAGLYLQGNADMPTLLWSHGNAEDLGLISPQLTYINQNLGYSILAYDYPGYGINPGKPNEQGCCDNIQLAWDYLRNSKGLRPDQIIIVGQSIGSGPSVWLAAKTSPAGLVLISPFTSINRIPFGYNIFPIDRFPNIKRIKKVFAPLLILHGDNDKVISPSHGKALFAAYPGKPADKTFISLKGVGHNDIHGSEDFYQALSEFVEKR